MGLFSRFRSSTASSSAKRSARARALSKAGRGLIESLWGRITPLTAHRAHEAQVHAAQMDAAASLFVDLMDSSRAMLLNGTEAYNHDQALTSAGYLFATACRVVCMMR